MNEQKTVSLTIEDWKNLLATMEAGIKAIGFPAFEVGGKLMSEIQKQLTEGKTDEPISS